MTVDSKLLLQLLEPAVRPGNLPGSTQAAKPGIHEQAFDELLNDAMTEAGETTEAAKPGAGDRLAVSPLSALNTIENASIWQLRASLRSATTDTLSPNV